MIPAQRLVSYFVLAAGVVACSTVVGVEVTRPPGEYAGVVRDDDEGMLSFDGGVTPEDDAGVTGADAGAPPEPCECGEGEACCLGATPACVPKESTCPAGGLRLDCRRSTNGRSCCWNESGPFASTSSSAQSCAEGRAACVDDADCAGSAGTCKTTSCSGVLVGACSTQDAGAPSCALNR